MSSFELADAPSFLARIVFEKAWLVDILRTIDAAAPPRAYAAAGVIRNTVWDFLHDRPESGPVSDVDVIYHDPAYSEADLEATLQSHLPQYRWEVTNQATVHRWQSAKLGRSLPPYESLDAALRSWPETATAVAVALGKHGELEVVAPFGLTDLFSMIVRPSPDLRDPDAYRCRVRDKNWTARWPRSTVLPLEPALGDAKRSHRA